jgi:ring-1,2-phenylacetyl-CoA epoxidase subunit PaaC
VNARCTYALRLADDALVAGQRLSECITRSPQIEEDVAAANVALDLLGQARAFYDYAGALHPDHPTEDELAYLRSDREFTNVALVELPNVDFAHTVARHLSLAAYQQALYAALAASSDPALAAIAGKSTTEVAYHFTHFAAWTRRLGDGTEESRARMQAALDAVWPYTYEPFEGDPLTGELAAEGVAPEPAGLRPQFEAKVLPVLAEATLTVPETTWRPTGGRRGLHTEGLGYLLAEMQSVARAHPGATW